MPLQNCFVKARENPFALERIYALGYLMPEPEWPRLLEKLSALGGRAAIVGPHGSGKTTLLLELATRLRAQGRVVRNFRLNLESGAAERAGLWQLLAGVRADEYVMLDGAEQLNGLWWQRFRFQARRAVGLIITTHARGRLPCLLELAPSSRLLADLVQRLAAVPALQAEQIGFRYTAVYGSNLREALRAMYDNYPNL